MKQAISIRRTMGIAQASGIHASSTPFRTHSAIGSENRESCHPEDIARSKPALRGRRRAQALKTSPSATSERISAGSERARALFQARVLPLGPVKPETRAPAILVLRWKAGGPGRSVFDSQSAAENAKTRFLGRTADATTTAFQNPEDGA